MGKFKHAILAFFLPVLILSNKGIDDGKNKNCSSTLNVLGEVDIDQKGDISFSSLFSDRANRSTFIQALLDKGAKDAFEEKLVSKITELPCYIDGSCKGEIAVLLEGIEELAHSAKFRGRGEDLAFKIVSLFRNYSEIPPSFYTFFNYCLEPQNLCSQKQFNLFFQVTDTTWGDRPHPSFYEKYVDKIITAELDDRKAKSPFNSKSLIFMSSSNRASKGKLNAKAKDVQVEYKNNKINGKPVYGNAIDTAISFERENIAMELLPNLGYNVLKIPAKKSKRSKLKIDKLINKLMLEDEINPERSPDIIINRKFIADIYSPLAPLDEMKLDVVVDGILSKTEGTNFSPITNKKLGKKNQGKRQANRVIVYASEIKLGSSPEVIAEILNQDIAERSPQYIEEAILLYEENNITKQLRVWP